MLLYLFPSLPSSGNIGWYSEASSSLLIAIVHFPLEAFFLTNFPSGSASANSLTPGALPPASPKIGLFAFSRSLRSTTSRAAASSGASASATASSALVATSSIRSDAACTARATMSSTVFTSPTNGIPESIMNSMVGALRRVRICFSYSRSTLAFSPSPTFPASILLWRSIHLFHALASLREV